MACVVSSFRESRGVAGTTATSGADPRSRGLSSSARSPAASIADVAERCKHVRSQVRGMPRRSSADCGEGARPSNGFRDTGRGTIGSISSTDQALRALLVVHGAHPSPSRAARQDDRVPRPATFPRRWPPPAPSRPPRRSGGRDALSHRRGQPATEGATMSATAPQEHTVTADADVRVRHRLFPPHPWRWLWTVRWRQRNSPRWPQHHRHVLPAHIMEPALPQG